MTETMFETTSLQAKAVWLLLSRNLVPLAGYSGWARVANAEALT
jgi:hypothetical protein